MRGTRMRGGGRLALVAALIGAALAGVSAPQAQAAPYAALVMDARTGEVLHARSADQRLHPASLTKMMTMYLAIEAVKQGRLGLDQSVPVSIRAASQPPSKIWLTAGSRATVRNLMRATAVKSANDAAVALAEATVGGSVEDWARLANAKAKMLGMTATTFRNPHGLTQQGHLSTARDMAILGRRLFFDHPEYYNLFGRDKTYAFGKLVRATNRRLLTGYPGADGIKTGYTNAAGFNLVASARRGGEHVIAALFGGRSSADRDRRIRELLDMGFARSPSQAPVIPPVMEDMRMASAPAPAPRPAAPKTLLARAAEAIAPTAQAAPARPAVEVAATAQAPQRAALPRARPGDEVIGVAMELPPARP